MHYLKKKSSMTFKQHLVKDERHFQGKKRQHQLWKAQSTEENNKEKNSAMKRRKDKMWHWVIKE